MIVDQSNRGLYMLLKCQIAAVRRKLRDRNPDLFRAFEIFVPYDMHLFNFENVRCSLTLCRNTNTRTGLDRFKAPEKL